MKECLLRCVSADGYGCSRGEHRGCRLRLWLDELLWERGPDAPDVLRAKGVLALAGCPQRHVLQVVRLVRMGAVLMTMHAGFLLAAAKNCCSSRTSSLTACCLFM